jgi:copper transport protein
VVVGAATLLACIVSVGLARPASAHAVLQSTSPSANSVLKTAPRDVLLTFGEAVTVGKTSVRVYDDHLQRVDSGPAGHPTGQATTVGVAVQSALAAGTYTVTWRVTSADTHVVSGGFTFSVGAPSRVVGTVPGLGANHAAAALLGVSRAVGYIGLIAGPGLLVALLIVWPVGLALRRLRGLVRVGALLIVVAGTVDLFLQGVYAQGLSLSQLFSSTAIGGTHNTRFGDAHITRLYLALPYFLLLRGRWGQTLLGPALRRGPGRAVVTAVACALGLALAATWSAAAHASVGAGAWLAMAMDTAHVAAMAVWLGGLLALALSVRSVAVAPEPVLPRFSRLAISCVTVVVGTGIYATWREVGTLPALVHTAYGWLLVTKVLIVIALLGIAGLSRAWVRRYIPSSGLRPRAVVHAHAELSRAAEPGPRQPDDAAVSSLRRSLVGELVFGAAVLAVTAALTGTAQARQTYAPSYTQTQSVGAHSVRLSIDRAHTGTSTIRLTVLGNGRPVTVAAVTGSVSLPSAGVGPLPLRFTPVNRSTHEAVAVFAVPGHWVVDVLVTFDALDATTFRFPVKVR